MHDYFDLIKEHQLESSISPEKWFALTYHFTDFMEYKKLAEKNHITISQKSYLILM